MVTRGQFLKLMVTVFVTAALLMGCGEKPADRIIGKWQGGSSDVQVTWEFLSDGTAIMTAINLSRGVAAVYGSWTILSDGRLKVQLSSRGETEVRIHALRFEGKSMYWELQSERLEAIVESLTSDIMEHVEKGTVGNLVKDYEGAIEETTEKHKELVGIMKTQVKALKKCAKKDIKGVIEECVREVMKANPVEQKLERVN